MPTHPRTTKRKPLDLADGVEASLLRTVGGALPALFEQAGHGMALVDAEARVVVANATLLDQLGRDEVSSARWPDLACFEHRGEVQAAIAGALDPGGSFSHEGMYLRPDGKEQWLLVAGTSVSGPGEAPVGLLLQAHDVTARRAEHEELRVAERRKSKFVGVASHELRTPLTAVLGFASTILRHWDEIPDAEKREYLELIEEQARRISRLVSDLLTVSRIESGRLEVRCRDLLVADPIGETIEQLGASAAEVLVSGPQDLRVFADPDHLRQILVNFVDNALKYGEPPVEVEVRGAGDSVELRVRDRGEGVPREFERELFDAFTRAGSLGSRSAPGTGLGLSIVRGLARAQGGDVWYEPNEPRGSCFAVRLQTPPAA